ncbi:MAG: hypothetical protein RLO06_05410 [Parvibaculum sp.]
MAQTLSFPKPVATWQISAPSNRAIRDCLERTADRLSAVYPVEWVSRSTSTAHVPRVDGWAPNIKVGGPGQQTCHGLISRDHPVAALLFWLVLRSEAEAQQDDAVKVVIQDEALTSIGSFRDARKLIALMGSSVSDVGDLVVKLGLAHASDFTDAAGETVRTDLWI